MLSWTKVLRFVKNRMALPSGFIEKTDEELKENIIDTALSEFSRYYPDEEFAPVLPDNENYQKSPRTGHFYFFDEEDLDILGITECYFNLAAEQIMGHPLYGPWSFEGAQWWALDVFKSRFFRPFSNYNYTYKFESPNVVQVLPENIKNNFLVKYMREHPHDLRKIPKSLEREFMELALAETLVWIGSIRSQYGDNIIDTPFGQIPLRGEDMRNRGEELRRNLIDKWETDTLPGPIIDTDG